MDFINDLFEQASDIIPRIQSIQFADYVDILLVAYLIYRVIFFFRKTNTYNIAKSLLVILAVLFISEVCKLTMINYILKKVVELGAIALFILFQPELRRFLEKFGSKLSYSRADLTKETDKMITQTILAAQDMSLSRTGALIIFERNVSLSEIEATGTVVNADVTAELLKNLFFDKAPMHDGAVIIKNGRIASAGCVLPLSTSKNLSKDLGMRHRAGIGLSEQTDAIVLIVSEETGNISLAVDGMLKRHQSTQLLDKSLHLLLSNEKDEEEETGFFKSVINFLKVNDNEEKSE